MVVNGNLLTEEEVVKDGALPGVVAGGLSSKVLLHLQRKTTVQFISSDGELSGGQERGRAKSERQK
jgi:hypothetical protein